MSLSIEIEIQYYWSLKVSPRFLYTMNVTTSSTKAHQIPYKVDIIRGKFSEIEKELEDLRGDLQHSMQETILLLSKKEREMERWKKLSVLLGHYDCLPSDASSSSSSIPTAPYNKILPTPDDSEKERFIPHCLNIVQCAAGAITTVPTLKDTASNNAECGVKHTATQRVHSSARMDQIRRATVEREGKIRELLDEMKGKLHPCNKYG